jgi:hypothetical protein
MKNYQRTAAALLLVIGFWQFGEMPTLLRFRLNLTSVRRKEENEKEQARDTEPPIRFCHHSCRMFIWL